MNESPVVDILEAQLRKSLGVPLTKCPPEDAAAHINNARQILAVTHPLIQSPTEVETNILAVESRLLKAIKLLGAE